MAQTGAQTAGLPLSPVWRPKVQALLARFRETALLLGPCRLYTGVCLPRPPAGSPLQGLVTSQSITLGSGLQPVAVGTRPGPYTTRANCILGPEQPPTGPPLEPGGRVDARRWTEPLWSVWPTWLAGRVSLDLKSDQPGSAPARPAVLTSQSSCPLGLACPPLPEPTSSRGQEANTAWPDG